MNVKRDLIYVSKFASIQMGPMTVNAMMDTHSTVMDYHAVVSNKYIITCMSCARMHFIYIRWVASIWGVFNFQICYRPSKFTKSPSC